VRGFEIHQLVQFVEQGENGDGIQDRMNIDFCIESFHDNDPWFIAVGARGPSFGR
jgi:hypothetical protein